MPHLPSPQPLRRRSPSRIRLQPSCRPHGRGRWAVLILAIAFAIIACASSSVALTTSATASAAFAVRSTPAATRAHSKNKCRWRPGQLFHSPNEDDDASIRCDLECEERTESPSTKTRREFFQQQLLATSALLPATAQAATDLSSTMDNSYFSLRNNNNIPYAQRQQLLTQQRAQQQERVDRRRKATTSFRTKKWTPFVNVEKWNSVETCLLEMLPVKNPVFRQLQELITNLEVFPATDSEGWKQTLLDALATLSFLDAKRSILEPVFNQDDATELYIAKSSLGEQNIEALRTRLEELIAIASGDIELDVINRSRATVSSREAKGKGIRRTKRRIEDEVEDINMEEAGEIDTDAFIEAKRQALITLSELGELLVPSFPYAVPTRGKFGYLPRLLGRCSVTLSFERPSTTASAFGLNLGGLSGKDKEVLGNVTIIADGYAAPITAGNFVDLSVRNFYTGLSVKAMRKRLGVVPTLSDNVIVNDLTNLRDDLDELKDAALVFPETLKKAKEGRPTKGDDPFAGSYYDETRMTMDAVLPILGSFQEGFYDPLTAKPRRIPLEVVALDPSSPTKSTLTYSSSYATLDDDMNGAGTPQYSALMSSSSAQRSFSSATSSSSSNSTAAAYSQDLDPVLSFNIPDVVALNHPDRVSNGGSSEFFALPRRDISTKRTRLLDGQYAPFGYIVEGSDVYQSLRPGDVIRAVSVSEVGLLNLVKIRKNAFEGAEEEVIVEEESSEGEG